MSTITLIDPARVRELVHDALFTDAEVVDGKPPTDHVRVEGVAADWSFHPKRLEAHRAEVREMLDRLPMTFRAQSEGGGGGWSFLNGCVCRDPERPDLPVEQMPLWTGMQLIVDELFTLGQALGYVKCLMPRQLWPMLPGGVPYYSITLGSGGELDG